MPQSDVDHFPPITNRHIFPRERSRSPNWLNEEPILTNRHIFPVEVEKTSLVRDGGVLVARTSGRDQAYREVALNPYHAQTRDREREDTPGTPEIIPTNILYGSRPPGGLGKPNNGGFSLRTELKKLNWTDALYVQVQKDLRALSRLHFSQDALYNTQLPGLQEQYLRAAAEKYPFLAKYPETWPAAAFANMYQKNRKDMAKDIASSKGA